MGLFGSFFSLNTNFVDFIQIQIYFINWPPERGLPHEAHQTQIPFKYQGTCWGRGEGLESGKKHEKTLDKKIEWGQGSWIKKRRMKLKKRGKVVKGKTRVNNERWTRRNNTKKTRNASERQMGAKEMGTWRRSWPWRVSLFLFCCWIMNGRFIFPLPATTHINRKNTSKGCVDF